MKTRKVPMRRCIGCMESRQKKELVRIVADKEGNVVLDGTGKAQGRGAYLCPSRECFEAARKKKAISRNLEISITEQQLEDLYREFEQYEK